jgi:hypothetical protein
MNMRAPGLQCLRGSEKGNREGSRSAGIGWQTMVEDGSQGSQRDCSWPGGSALGWPRCQETRIKPEEIRKP